MTACAVSLLLLLTDVAVALKPANPADEKAISALLKSAEELSAGIRHEAHELQMARSALMPSKEQRNKLTALPPKISAWQAQHDAKVASAVELTLRTYGIVPVVNGSLRMPRARSVAKDFEGPERIWSIRFGRELALGPIRSNTVEHRYPEPKRDDRGRTFPDGTTVIWGYFGGDSRLLALLLYHELRHFEQFTTPGQGDRWSFADREKDAYGAERRSMGPMGMGKWPAFERYMNGFFRDKLIQVDEMRKREKPDSPEAAAYAEAEHPPHSQAWPAPARAPESEVRLPVPSRAEERPMYSPASPAAMRAQEVSPAPVATEDVYVEPPEKTPPRGYYDPCIEEGRSCLKR